ncbi:glycerate kinase [Hydrogenovibrio kuenenii]|uniref:glycerate kinase n=1 Tax=Hydrogenovibrio kuenenii TaxID=63658 RepID=UPI0004663CF3|nr:glycerate kinase [Hydrogenovibrio kuenenii]
MKILIAPDSFKGSLEAVTFCEVATQAIHSVYPQAEVISQPMADGGEGMVDTLSSLNGAEKIAVKVQNPIGETVTANYAYLADSDTAIIEMAAASGLPLLKPEQRKAMKTSTYGTGELIQDALAKGAKHFILGLGGSATTDAGIGCLAALGFQFLNANKESVSLDGEGLLALDTIIPPENFDLDSISVQVACDISNPLYGETGAAHMFGPQKGATSEEVALLDQGLKNFARVVQKDLGMDIANIPGAGAAGGMGAGLVLLGGQLASGFQIVSELLELEQQFQKHQFDLVITGEGQFNEQSQYGKVPVEVAKLAKKYDVFVVGIVGGIDFPITDIHKLGIDAIFSITDRPLALEDCFKEAKPLLFNLVQNIVRLAFYLK